MGTCFFGYARMTLNRFDYLISLVKGKITKTVTYFRKPVTAEERLLFTLVQFSVSNIPLILPPYLVEIISSTPEIIITMLTISANKYGDNNYHTVVNIKKLSVLTRSFRLVGNTLYMS